MIDDDYRTLGLGFAQSDFQSFPKTKPVNSSFYIKEELFSDATS